MHLNALPELIKMTTLTRQVSLPHSSFLVCYNEALCMGDDLPLVQEEFVSVKGVHKHNCPSITYNNAPRSIYRSM